ncbi:hypothetical protein KY290_010815 [Solanum tuberosum]|uniref:Uncharacterized protein n=1 Tax=Solanum tuberosum TaxID=4113 RepID=A0ABQ7VYU4_SOLTU|nr:hypothetical protein KY290_010815 [Solanum tuberosum]
MIAIAPTYYLSSDPRSIETSRSKEQIEAPPSSSSRPALELPSVASSVRDGSLPLSLSVESSSPSTSSISSKFLSTSIDPKGGGVKYPFDNAGMGLKLWGCGFCSTPSNLLHDEEEASTTSATKHSDTNNDPSHRESSVGFFNEDLHDKIVVVVDVDEGNKDNSVFE